MASASDEEFFYLKNLIKSLGPDESGKFEPMSGIMLLNISASEFEEASVRFLQNRMNDEDIKLAHVINHETYHYVQTGASGYGFDRQRRAFSLFKADLLQPIAAEGELKDFLTLWRGTLTHLREDHGYKNDARAELLLAEIEHNIKLPTDKLFAHLRASVGENSQQPIDDFAAMVDGLIKLQLFERALPGDNSAIGSILPRYFNYVNELTEHEKQCNTVGLSILGLLEGSAVAYAHLVRSHDRARAELEAELATLEPVYQELYRLSVAQLGDRALELMLPAVALALCYSEPHYAYSAMLSALSMGETDTIMERGRKIAANLPALPDAGAILGTAIDVRNLDNSYPMYDAFIEALKSESEGVDVYAVLSDPAALQKMRRLPFILTTADSWHHGDSVTRQDELVRLVIMSWVLRVTSRRRKEIELMRSLPNTLAAIFFRL